MRRPLLIGLLLIGTVGGFGYGFASKAAHYKHGGAGWCHGKQGAVQKDSSSDVAPEAPPEDVVPLEEPAAQ